ncbi:sulfatase-like hydrolase/transferase [Endozoicomonas ascidiicola]|uniref:sulfatase-like hydrolase/transferase n=1 Tax=Endozoicomonas ascidiicola TaxID=1698521 RepID=UPI00083391D6|nr:sulfatase-like hydrolase/transferase [Endozoicomonas ascidiicola]
MTNRRDFLKASALFTVAGATSGLLSASDKVSTDNAAPKQPPAKRPNIVFFLSDQHRRHAMGFWQNPQYSQYLNGVSDPVHTPYLDKFADQSVVLSQCISTAPVCSPHRAMLMSSMYPHANGVSQNCRADREWGLLPGIETLGDVLSKNNYSCGYIGKWHLDKPEPNDPQNPGKYVAESDPRWKKPLSKTMDSYTPPELRQGFDYWYAFGAHSNHDAPHYYDTDGNRHEPKKWATEHETDIAINYLQNNQGQRVQDKPFCLFVSTNLPHNPYNTLKDTDDEMYHAYYSDDKVSDVKDLLNRPNFRHGPLPMKMGTQEQGSSEGLSTDTVRYYFSSVSGVDRNFGRLMEALEATGQADNTIVVYSSDHGDMMGSHGLMAKACIYEESLGIPMIVRYPEKLKPSVNDVLMGSLDFMPTLLGLAGLSSEIPTSAVGNNLSENLVKQNDGLDKPEYVPFLLHTYQKGLRTDRYSLSINKAGQGVLFDNIKDPYQMDNLFDKKSDTVKEMGKVLGKILRQSNDIWFQERLNKDIISYS